MIGETVSHYRIIAKLGAGGMGEVYRATDTKLTRDVALKILPEGFAANAERMARFEREAQVLASLNHPNIAAIYGLEESSQVRALVMELVEGPTLADRLKAGGIPFDEALPVAKQIAEGLEYAHERGIIHRDLKPANIKVTPEGTVKILDFGLAKALDSGSTSSPTGTQALQDSPTLTAAATRAGVILGTAAYMPPEQARGKTVDRRADIWAFGCVLYEMLTSKRLFDGETVSDTLAAVLKSEPDWNALPRETPASIEKLLRRCLAKDPKQRLQAIGEARIAMEEGISGVAADFSPQQTDVTLKVGVTAAGRITAVRRALPWAVSAVFLVLAVLFAFAWYRASSAPVQSIRAPITAPEEASFAFSMPMGAPVVSPDGTRLVFSVSDASGKEALWVRPLDSLTAQPLQGTEDGVFPFWAPDSRQLGYFQDGKLKKIDVTGGPPVLLCDAPNGRGGAWSRNNVIVFAPEVNGGLSSVAAAGGTPTAIASPTGTSGNFTDRWPVFLPDGRHFLYLSGDPFSPGTPMLGIRVAEIGTNEQKFLLQADSGALYAPPGYLLFLRGDTLMAQRFDAGSLKLEGEAFTVAEHVPSPQSFRLGLFSVSQTGLLVYATGAGERGGQLVWMDASGKEIGKVGQPGVLRATLSADGTRLAYEAENSSGNRDIWVMDLARGVQTRFTFGPGNSRYPVWSPDCARIAYASAGNKFLVKDSSGAGNAEPLLGSGGIDIPYDWSRDGRYILFTSYGNAKTGADLWVLPLFGDRKPFPYLQTQFNESNGVFSPDGHWVAYGSNESGNYEVYLSPFPPGGGKWQISQAGGVQPEWNRDGSALYYLAPSGKLMEVRVQEKGPAVEIGTPRQLFQKPFARAAPSGRSYAVAPDGRRFLVNVAEQAASPPLTLVTNWTASLPH